MSDDTITLPLLSVLIDTERGATTLSVQVPEHEVDVLKAVHRPERVRVQGDADEEIELNANLDAEWARLHRKYKRPNESSSPVDRAFREGPKALAKAGFSTSRGSADHAPQAQVRKHPKKAVKKAPKPTGEGK